jgi:hypothetical protein
MLAVGTDRRGPPSRLRLSSHANATSFDVDGRPSLTPQGLDAEGRS